MPVSQVFFLLFIGIIGFDCDFWLVLWRLSCLVSSVEAFRVAAGYWYRRVYGGSQGRRRQLPLLNAVLPLLICRKRFVHDFREAAMVIVIEILALIMLHNIIFFVNN